MCIVKSIAFTQYGELRKTYFWKFSGRTTAMRVVIIHNNSKLFSSINKLQRSYMLRAIFRRIFRRMCKKNDHCKNVPSQQKQSRMANCICTFILLYDESVRRRWQF